MSPPLLSFKSSFQMPNKNVYPDITGKSNSTCPLEGINSQQVKPSYKSESQPSTTTPFWETVSSHNLLSNVFTLHNPQFNLWFWALIIIPLICIIYHLYCILLLYIIHTLKCIHTINNILHVIIYNKTYYYYSLQLIFIAYSSKDFTYIHSFNPHKNPMR